jgi:hypothetical protein
MLLLLLLSSLTQPTAVGWEYDMPKYHHHREVVWCLLLLLKEVNVISFFGCMVVGCCRDPVGVGFFSPFERWPTPYRTARRKYCRYSRYKKHARWAVRGYRVGRSVSLTPNTNQIIYWPAVAPLFLFNAGYPHGLAR